MRIYQNKKSEEIKSEPIKKSSKIEENEVILTKEELEKFELIPEFNCRTNFIKYYKKKQLSKYMKYLTGVKCMIDSVTNHGFEVAKHFFLNPIDCKNYSLYSTPRPMPVSQESMQVVTPFNTNSSISESKVSDPKLIIASVEQTIHYCNQQSLKINDLQNFIFNTMKWLLLNYPEYGKDIEEIEQTLVYILTNSISYLDSK